MQDVFVNRKVPRFDRDRVPLLAAGDGDLLWVGGVGAATKDSSAVKVEWRPDAQIDASVAVDSTAARAIMPGNAVDDQEVVACASNLMN